MDVKAVEKAIGDHCYDGFPRKIGFPRQVLCHSLEELVEAFWRYNGAAMGLYTAVFPESVKERKLYNKFYFDLDGTPGNLIYPYRDSLKIDKVCKELFRVKTRKYFSGMKGFALYLDIEPTLFKDYPVVHLRLASYLREQGIATIDGTSLGDTSRISRLPFTIHTGSNRLCIPVDPDWRFNTIISESEHHTKNFTVKVAPAPQGTEGMCILERWDDTAGDYRNSLKAELGCREGTGYIDLERLYSRAEYTKGFRRVLMYRVIIPQMVQHGHTDEDIHFYCKTFIEKSGAEYRNTDRRFVEHYIHFDRENSWNPVSVLSLITEYPELKGVILP